MSLTTIKSYQNGIALHLDPTADFEDVLADVATKFEESRKFFKNAKVALSIEDRVLSEEEEKRIVVAINEHSDVNLMCLVGKNEETNRKYVKALKRMESQFAENNTRLYVGNINEGDIIESEGSLIVYGNVEMGGAAVAKKDIIVMGDITGQIYAGTSGDKKSIVICFGLAPMKLTICDIKYLEKGRMGFGKKIKFVPQMLKIENDKIVSEIIDEHNIQELIKR